MKPLAEQTLYELLEIPPDAPEAEIVRAWERVEALYGPGSLATYTLISPDDAALLGRKLEEALNVLLDPDRRRAYDARLGQGPGPAAAEDLSARIVRLPPIIPPLPASRPPAAAELRPVPAGHDEVRAPRCEADGAAGQRPALTPAPALAFAEVAAAPAEETPAALAAQGTSVEASAEQHDPRAAASVDAASGSAAGQLEAVPAANEVPAAILLAAVVEPDRPIPLDTPVPTSPPFAAVSARPPGGEGAGSAPGELRRAEAPASPVGEQGQGGAPAAPAESAVFDGAVLRRVREARGISIAQMCERTKITRHHLENLEAGRYDRLPVPVYLRGILMAIAKELRLDGQKVARSYLETMAAAPPPPPPKPGRLR